MHQMSHMRIKHALQKGRFTFNKMAIFVSLIILLQKLLNYTDTVK